MCHPLENRLPINVVNVLYFMRRKHIPSGSLSFPTLQKRLCYKCQHAGAYWQLSVVTVIISYPSLCLTVPPQRPIERARRYVIVATVNTQRHSCTILLYTILYLSYNYISTILFFIILYLSYNYTYTIPSYTILYLSYNYTVIYYPISFLLFTILYLYYTILCYIIL